MNFEIGISALRASQFALGTVAQNLANANTQGYHRQLPSFESRIPQKFDGHFFGSGVDIRLVNRARSQTVEASLTNSIADLQQIESRLSAETQIESLFLPGEGSLQSSLTSFFSELASLSANPTELVQRNAAVQQGVALATEIRGVSNQLADLKLNVHSQIELEVEALNRDIQELVSLQHEISVKSTTSIPNDLLDRRDQLVNRIAEKIDIQRNEHSQNGFGLTISAQSINIGRAPIQFESHVDEEGNLSYRILGTDREVQFQGGRLNGLQQVYNETIDTFQTRLDEFASELIHQVDQAHATGVGLDGSYTVLRGSRPPSDPSLPLRESGLPFPLENGELNINVTASNGRRRLYTIDIDPDTHSLADVAGFVAALPGLNGLVSSQTNELVITADEGFEFDFAGNLETIPNLGMFDGSSIPSISGRYEGNVNQDMYVEIEGNGTIGVTPGLMARVYDEDGGLTAEFEIGDSYAAGSELSVADGVSISFRAGDVMDGDNFTTRLVANSDTSGILSALGLNSFFAGTVAADMEVRQELIDDPHRLAVSKSGDTGDTLNLENMVGLRSDLVLGEGTLSFEDYLGDVVSNIGFRVRTSQNLQSSVTALQQSYQLERDSVSGVDVNEEMINLSKFQKAYEASVQVIRTMESMLDDLYRIIG